MPKKLSKKVLLVEDDATQSMMYQLEFTNSGYTVILAESGAKALKLAVKELPDIIFLDLLLGDMGGLELLAQLKAKKETQGIKAVVLSNLQKTELAEQAKKLGAIDYLIKMQYIPKDIVAKAEKYLRA